MANVIPFVEDPSGNYRKAADGDTLVDEAGNPIGGGGGAAQASWLAPYTQDITAVTAPTSGSKGNFSTLDYIDGVTTGQRFEFTVPNDYDSGDLTLRAVYAMSTALSADIVVATAAEIAKVTTGTIDTTTYPEANATVTPLTTTSIGQVILKTLTAGDFTVGDVIQFFVKRIGANGSDTHTGNWQVIGFEVLYTSSVAGRTLTQSVRNFSTTDESSATAGTKGNFNTLDFATGVDQEHKFEVHVPVNWDGTSELILRLTYAMSTTESSKFVVISTEGDVGDVSAGTLNTLSVEDITIAVPADTNLHRSTIIRAIPASAVAVGDQLAIKVKRKGTSVSDTHGGSFQLLSAEVVTSEILTQASTTLSTTELYLDSLNFSQVSGSATADVETPDLGVSGDYETWYTVTGSATGDRVDTSFQGRLSNGQTQITSIKIPLKGTGQYNLKVYFEGVTPGTPVYASGLLSAPASRTVTTLDSTDYGTSYPTGDGKYFVVVEATVDNTETVKAGRPLAKQE